MQQKDNPGDLHVLSPTIAYWMLEKKNNAAFKQRNFNNLYIETA